MDNLFKQVEQAKQEWETTVDVIEEGVALFEISSMKILRANWTIARFFATKPQDLIGVNIHTLLCGCEKKDCMIKKILESLRADSLEFRQETVNKDWHMNIYPIPDAESESSRSVIVLRDITQEKIWQERIHIAEEKAAKVRAMASLIQEISPSMNYIKHNLYLIANHLGKLRDAFKDYRMSLNALTNKDKSIKASNWQEIEEEHSVEFRLLDIEQSVRQSMRDLNQIGRLFEGLSYLELPSEQMMYSDLGPILQNTMKTVEEELHRKTTFISSGNLPMVLCHSSRLQTAFFEILSAYIKTTQKEDELSIRAKYNEEIVNIVVNHKKGKSTSEIGLTTEEFPDFKSTFYLILREDFSPVFGIIKEHGGKFEFNDADRSNLFVAVTLPIHGVNNNSEESAS